MAPEDVDVLVEDVVTEMAPEDVDVLVEDVVTEVVVVPAYKDYSRDLSYVVHT